MKTNNLIVLTIALIIGSAINIFAGANNHSKSPVKDKLKVGLLEFSGDTSRVNQNSILGAMAEHLNSKGFEATTASSTKGKFHYFVGVEIKSSRKSGLTFIITLYGKDKNVIKQVSKSKSGTDDDSLRKFGGGSDDSIRPMVLKGLDELPIGKK